MKLGAYWDDFMGQWVDSSSSAPADSASSSGASSADITAAVNAAYTAGATAAGNAGISTSDWTSLITKALPQLPAAISSWQLSQVNLARAERGLPALNAAAYSPQVGVGLTPQTSQMLTYGLLGIAALIFMSKRTGARPRRA